MLTRFIELGAGTGAMLTTFIDVLQDFDLLRDLVVCVVDASKSLRDLQISRVNQACLAHDVVPGYVDSDGLEALQCAEANLTFIWFPSVEDLLRNMPQLNPEVRRLIPEQSAHLLAGPRVLRCAASPQIRLFERGMARKAGHSALARRPALHPLQALSPGGPPHPGLLGNAVQGR